MAQTGYTPILIYSSSTAAAAPAAGNLTNSTLGSELAINITDGKLFYKDNANAIQVIGWKTTPTTAGGTGLTSYTAGDLLYYATGTALSKLAIGTANTVLTSSGSAPQWSTALTLSGNVTAAAFIPSGSSIPTNGMYYPTTNVLSWATNSALRMTLDSAGNLSTNTSTNNVYDQVAGARALLIQKSDTSTTVGGSLASITISNTDTTTSNAAQLNFAAITGASANQYSAAVIACIFGARTNGQYPTGSLAFLTSTSLNSAPSEKARIWASGGVSIGDTTDPGAGNLRIGTGNLVIGTSAKGIDFSATPGTGTSELFNDYETGVWTPTFSSSSGSFTSITYDSAVTGAKYTKIGNTVYIQGSIRTSAITVGTASGNLLITGLPFSAVTNVTGQDGTASGSVSQSSAWAVNTPSSVQVSGSQITLFHRITANGASALTQVSDAGTGASANLIRFSCMYLTAEL